MISGDVYKGEWLDGAKSGKGEYYFANGDIYKGSFFQGMRHGKGRYKWDDQSGYDG